MFACRLCVCCLRRARGSEFPGLGHALCFPVECNWAGQAGSSSLKTLTFSRGVPVSGRHGVGNARWAQRGQGCSSCKHISSQHLPEPAGLAQGSGTNAPSPGVFLPGEGRGTQFIADPLLNWSQPPSNPTSSSTSSCKLGFPKPGGAEVGSESPPGESVGSVARTDLPVPDPSSGGAAWAGLCPLLSNPLP